MMLLIDPVKQAARARNVARKRGLAANLSGDEWIQTIKDFGGVCAYCGEPYATIDHFIPLACSGGSTIDNCVPSCVSCNQNKASTHPRDSCSIPRESILRVERYLQQRGRLFAEQQGRWPADIPANMQKALRLTMEQEMVTKETRCRIQILSNGKEIRIFSNGQIRLQFRSQPCEEEGKSLSYSTGLMALEAYELGLNLLRIAHPLLEQGLSGSKDPL